MTETVLRFLVKTAGSPKEVFSRFHPQGKIVLNRTEWRGKEPRSCGVTSLRSRPHVGRPDEPMLFDIEVSYRPKGCVNYIGETRYDGWTAMLLRPGSETTALDEQGKPLSEGRGPVYVPCEVHEDVDYNEIDFGEFLGEAELRGIKHLTWDDVRRQFEGAQRIVTGAGCRFAAPRRHRPLVKVVLSNHPSGTAVDGFGTRIVMVNHSTAYLEQVITDHILELVSGFVEGRYSMKAISVNDFTYVEVGDVLVDCTPNEHGAPSRFNCLNEFVPAKFLDELANRLMATYEVDVSVVDGEHAGLVLRPQTPQ